MLESVEAAVLEVARWIYIAGPMTGLPDLNFPAFHRAASVLRAAGHVVKNPAEICPNPTTEWQACMFRDLEALDRCDGVLMLEGWEMSPGAQIERLWAMRTGKFVLAPSMLTCIELQMNGSALRNGSPFAGLVQGARG